MKPQLVFLMLSLVYIHFLYLFLLFITFHLIFLSTFILYTFFYSLLSDAKKFCPFIRAPKHFIEIKAIRFRQTNVFKDWCTVYAFDQKLKSLQNVYFIFSLSLFILFTHIFFISFQMSIEIAKVYLFRLFILK